MYFGLKNFLTQKYSLPKSVFDPKNLGPKNIWEKKYFLSKIFGGSIFDPQIFCTKKKDFGTKYISLGPKLS